MGKSRNRKWYDYEDNDYSNENKKKLVEDRRRQKRMKNALRSRDYGYLKEQDDESNY